MTPSGLISVTFHPRLAAVFDAMNSAGVRWALLRTPGRPASPTGDVDLLVHPSDARSLALLLRPMGFAPKPGYATAPDPVFISYDEESATWLILDIATEVSFGRDFRFRAAAADDLLRRSRAVAGARMLALDDQFWALLLHCLLEKDVVSDRHQATLQELASSADARGALGTAVASSCPPGWDPCMIVSAAAAGRWYDIEGIRVPLRHNWLRAHRGDVVYARLRWLRRVLRGLRAVGQRRGISVVLLGQNGAGKSTVADALLKAFPEKSHLCYLGLWKEERPAGPLRRALRVVARPVFVWSRYATSLLHRAKGELVVFDRYVYDAFLPPKSPLVWLKRPYLWALAHSCPAPTMTVILDVPGDVAWERKGENSVDEGERERQVLLGLRNRLRRVHVVDATRPLERVVGDVTALVWARYADRWIGRTASPR